MKKAYLFFILVFITLFILINFVSADIGPKPTVEINISYMGKFVSDNLFYAEMLDCIKEENFYLKKQTLSELNISEYDSINNCYWIPAYFAWGGACKESMCSFGYSPPDEFKLAIYIPSLNKVFITNKISRKNFNSNYEVDLNYDGSAKIVETTPLIKKDNIRYFIRALILTLIIEFFASFIYLSKNKLSKKILISVLIGSLITLPFVWFVFPMIIKIIVLVVLLSEIFAILFETYFIYYLNKNAITLKKSFVLSVIINLTSLIIGYFVLFVLRFVFNIV